MREWLKKRGFRPGGLADLRKEMEWQYRRLEYPDN